MLTQNAVSGRAADTSPIRGVAGVPSASVMAVKCARAAHRNELKNSATPSEARRTYKVGPSPAMPLCFGALFSLNMHRDEISDGTIREEWSYN